MQELEGWAPVRLTAVCLWDWVFSSLRKEAKSPATQGLGSKRKASWTLLLTQCTCP